MAENSTPPSRRIKQRVLMLLFFISFRFCLFVCLNQNVVVYRGNVFNNILRVLKLMYYNIKIQATIFTLDEQFKTRTDGSGYCLLWLFKKKNQLRQKKNKTVSPLLLIIYWPNDMGQISCPLKFKKIMKKNIQKKSKGK